MHRITRNKFTLIEVLMVLLIAGILLGVSLAGLSRMLGRQGASGAVRSLSAQLALARSYAVVKNSYVALLLPDDNGTYSSFIANNLSFYCYTKSRICLVSNFDSTATPSAAKFAGWIDGNEWQNLPSGVCAQFDTVLPSSAPFQVTGIDGNAALNSTAIVFTTNGTVAGGNKQIRPIVPANSIARERMNGRLKGNSPKFSAQNFRENPKMTSSDSRCSLT